MGFLTANKPLVRTLSDGFNDGAGALATSKWTLVDVGGGTPQTTRDIDATGTDIREPGTATLAPHAYFAWYPITNRLTFRVSMSVKGTNANNGPGAFITLFRPDLAAGSRIVGRVGIADTSGTDVNMDSFQLRWRGQNTNVAFVSAAATYYRVGIEVDAENDLVRGYLNPTASISDSSGDPGLVVRATFSIDSGTLPFDDNEIYVGIGLSAAGGVGSNYSGAENILIEEWKVPFSASFLGGSFFPTMNDPYTIHKSTLAVHELLNRAQLA